MPTVFVSYSRRDFHAAEALTSVLAASGQVTPWLDVEHLRPGTDWEAAINGAIDAADAVVVVGSPAAMASKWVTGEWQRALRNGTPVHVALVHKTELPPELTSVHDLRGSFFTEARRLVGVIWGQAAPRPRRRFPVSAQLALLWAALTFCTVVAGVGATLGWDLSQVYGPVHAGMARLGLTVALANVVGAGGLIYLMVRLFRRSASPESLRQGLHALAWTVVMSLVGTLMAAGTSYREAGGQRTDSAWLYLASGAVAVFAFVLVSRSRTVHLEMPTGVGDASIRGRLRGQRVSRRRFGRLWAAYRPKFAVLKAANPGSTYWVWCHVDDAPIGKLVADTCAGAGFVEDETDPRWAFLVVTTRTPDQVIRSAREVLGDRVVFVLATSMRVADDELRRHQWLDFREQEPEGLYEFLHAAATGRPAERGVVTAPMGADTFRAPRYVTNYLVFGRMLLGFAAAPPLGMVLAGDFARAVPVALVTALLAAAVINLMRRTATRTVTGGGWGIRTFGVLAVFIGWLVVAPAIPHIPPVNRIVLFVVVTLHLFGSTKVMLDSWLPPERAGEVVFAFTPVHPPRYTFSLPLMTLALATGYFFVTQA